MTLLEKEIVKRKNLKQFKSKKFGVIVPAELSIELEARDRLKLSKQEYADFKKKKEVWEQERLQKKLEREAKEKALEAQMKREAERREKKFKQDLATREWRRREIPKPVLGEFKSFKDLAANWKESTNN
jgi:hypothetical protein